MLYFLRKMLAVGLTLLVAGQAVAAGERRIALVIGNAAYPGVPLANPVNDARDMAAALKKLGFEVIEKTDATQKEMNRAIGDFGSRLRADTVALFFYAGHGMQVKGKNYLIPIDAQIASEATVRTETVDVDSVMDQLSISPLNIVILDACRNNPFERRFRSTGGGLAQMDAPKGSLIAYATAPGKVASDGSGKNGLYTQEILKHIQTPGLDIEKVFKRVRTGVMAGSGDAQTPWESSSLTGDFFFVAGSAATSLQPPPQVAQLTPAVAAARTPQQIEDELWDTIKDSDKPGVFETYMKEYPKGRYLSQARVRLAGLKEAAKPTPAVPLAPATSPVAVTPAKPEDPETQFWNEVKAGGTKEYYDIYVKQYPKGKYLPLAKAELKKLDDQEKLQKAREVAEQQRLARETAEREKAEVERLAREGPKPGQTFKDCPECPDMLILPADSYDMGSPSYEAGRHDNESPMHRVSVKSFALAKTHITRGQFAAFVNTTGYQAGGKCFTFEGGKYEERSGRNWRDPGFQQNDSHPAVCINWYDAKAYVDWLSRKTGKQYRLPSEAELEYAIRGGTTTARWWGDSPDHACSHANVGDQTAKSQGQGIPSETHNCSDGLAYTSPVASFKPNAFGLYDMIGNAWVWAEDCWHDNYNGAPSDGSAWTSDECKWRVLRGGSWIVMTQYARSASRLRNLPAYRNNHAGFRPASTLPTAGAAAVKDVAGAHGSIHGPSY